MQQLLQHAFVAMPHLKQVLLTSKLDFDADIQQQQQQQRQTPPSLPDAAVTLFAKASSVEQGSRWLYDCSRQMALPSLQVRRNCTCSPHVQGGCAGHALCRMLALLLWHCS